MVDGKVYLVGGGPGDPGLLTLRGLECLQQADLVLYDGLVNPLLLRHTCAHTERTCRSPSPDGRVLRQDEINQQLIAAARAGKTVVRLKGGDPFIFGRGGEEATALKDAGIPFEVVPGISAATAAAAYAGISLTHRQFASMVVFVTGHEDPAKVDSSVDYGLLGKFPGTIVFYMGLHRLESIVTSLLKNGRPVDEPACVISRGTLPTQEIVTGPLHQLPQAVQAAKLHAPSLVIVGDCVTQQGSISWFDSRPLFGQRIGITRPEKQADLQIKRAISLGADPVIMPLIEIAPPDDWSETDQTIDNLAEYEWIVFTSVNGVDAFLGRIWQTGRDWRILSSIKLAAIGPATAGALEARQLRADIVPPSFRSEDLAETLAPHVSGCRILWPRANRGRQVLPEQLNKQGAQVDELIVYQHVDVQHLPAAINQQLESGAIYWIGLSSPAIARQLARLLPDSARRQLGESLRLASISPVTSAAAVEAGLTIDVEATTYTWDGIFDAIVAFRQ